MTRPFWKVPFFRSPWGEQERQAVMGVMEGDELSYGEITRKFEERFRAQMGRPHNFTCSSGTAALELALGAFAQGGAYHTGDRIACPSFTFAAVPNAIVNMGLEPVFLDVDPQTMNVPLENLKREKDLVGFICVHTFGTPCADIEEIEDYCARGGIILIEDCAEACGASMAGRRVGLFGDAACFSFNTTKNLCTGEGGMVTTHDDTLATHIERIRNHGLMSNAQQTYRDVLYPGRNLRLPTIQCAIGLEQLKKLYAYNIIRSGIAEKYRDALRGSVEFQRPSLNGEHVHQLFTIRVGPERDIALKRIRERGIEAKVYFNPPLHETTYYRNYGSWNLPHTERLSREVLTLPLYPAMDKDQIEYVATTTREVMDEIKTPVR
jgi:perosamine synthetase